MVYRRFVDVVAIILTNGPSHNFPPCPLLSSSLPLSLLIFHPASLLSSSLLLFLLSFLPASLPSSSLLFLLHPYPPSFLLTFFLLLFLLPFLPDSFMSSSSEDGEIKTSFGCAILHRNMEWAISALQFQSFLRIPFVKIDLNRVYGVVFLLTSSL